MMTHEHQHMPRASQHARNMPDIPWHIFHDLMEESRHPGSHAVSHAPHDDVTTAMIGLATGSVTTNHNLSSIDDGKVIRLAASSMPAPIRRIMVHMMHTSPPGLTWHIHAENLSLISDIYDRAYHLRTDGHMTPDHQVVSSWSCSPYALSHHINDNNRALSRLSRHRHHRDGSFLKTIYRSIQTPPSDPVVWWSWIHDAMRTTDGRERVGRACLDIDRSPWHHLVTGSIHHKHIDTASMRESARWLMNPSSHADEPMLASHRWGSDGFGRPSKTLMNIGYAIIQKSPDPSDLDDVPLLPGMSKPDIEWMSAMHTIGSEHQRNRWYAAISEEPWMVTDRLGSTHLMPVYQSNGDMRGMACEVLLSHICRIKKGMDEEASYHAFNFWMQMAYHWPNVLGAPCPAAPDGTCGSWPLMQRIVRSVPMETVVNAVEKGACGSLAYYIAQTCPICRHITALFPNKQAGMPEWNEQQASEDFTHQTPSFPDMPIYLLASRIADGDDRAMLMLSWCQQQMERWRGKDHEP